MRSFRRAGRQGRQRNDPEDAPIFRTGEEGGRGGTEGAQEPAERRRTVSQIPREESVGRRRE